MHGRILLAREGSGVARVSSDILGKVFDIVAIFFFTSLAGGGMTAGNLINGLDLIVFDPSSFIFGVSSGVDVAIGFAVFLAGGVFLHLGLAALLVVPGLYPPKRPPGPLSRFVKSINLRPSFALVLGGLTTTEITFFLFGISSSLFDASSSCDSEGDVEGSLYDMRFLARALPPLVPGVGSVVWTVSENSATDLVVDGKSPLSVGDCLSSATVSTIDSAIGSGRVSPCMPGTTI